MDSMITNMLKNLSSNELTQIKNLINSILQRRNPSRSKSNLGPDSKLPDKISPKLPDKIAPKLPDKIAPKLPDKIAPKLPDKIAPKLPDKILPSKIIAKFSPRKTKRAKIKSK